jgi:hypothetical protein
LEKNPFWIRIQIWKDQNQTFEQEFEFCDGNEINIAQAETDLINLLQDLAAAILEIIHFGFGFKFGKTKIKLLKRSLNGREPAVNRALDGSTCPG